MFSGSYAAGDVSFLLKQLTVEPIADVEQKERLIQSGRKHYSEVIGIERQPSAEYLALFDRAVEDNASLMARDLYWVALRILAARPGGITLVSLARAGSATRSVFGSNAGAATGRPGTIGAAGCAGCGGPVTPGRGSPVTFVVIAG